MDEPHIRPGQVISARFDPIIAQGGPFKLGIMGGTFDPIHHGHLVCAQQALETYELDGVVFMVSGISPFKDRLATSSPLDRFEMVRRAVQDNPSFDASSFEIDIGGTSYTARTLLAMRRLYQENVELFFITGADAMLSIRRWKDAEQLRHLARFIAASRPGYSLEKFKRDEEEHGMGAFDVSYLEVPLLAISSTELRARIRAGRTIRYLAPEPVIGYIEEKGLYRPKASASLMVHDGSEAPSAGARRSRGSRP